MRETHTAPFYRFIRPMPTTARAQLGQEPRGRKTIQVSHKDPKYFSLFACPPGSALVTKWSPAVELLNPTDVFTTRLNTCSGTLMLDFTHQGHANTARHTVNTQ